jgi:hypothetical protein
MPTCKSLTEGHLAITTISVIDPFQKPSGTFFELEAVRVEFPLTSGDLGLLGLDPSPLRFLTSNDQSEKRGM